MQRTPLTAIPVGYILTLSLAVYMYVSKWLSLFTFSDETFVRNSDSPSLRAAYPASPIYLDENNEISTVNTK